MHETKNFDRMHFFQQFCRSCSQLLASIDISSYSNRKSIANKYDSFHINVRSIIYIYIYIIDPMFISSTKYRSHAIKEPFRHRPTFIVSLTSGLPMVRQGLRSLQNGRAGLPHYPPPSPESR